MTGDGSIRVFGRLGHAADVVVRAHAGRAGPPERGGAVRIAPQLEVAGRERGGIVRLDDQASTGL